MRRVFVFLLILSPWMAHAQPLDTLTPEAFFDIVEAHHPVARIADLQVSIGERKLQASRGNFDPLLFSDYNTKDFKGKDYYDLTNIGVKIPTWFGLEGYTGYEYNTGQFLNPENSTTSDGLTYAGVKWSVGSGLLMDDRRAALRQADIFRRSSEQQRIILLNDLYMNAGEVYWEWAQSYYQLKVSEEAVEIAKTRLRNVRISALLGDLPIIDTVESYLQFQARTSLKNQYELDYINKKYQLSSFLWYNGQFPIYIGNNVIPPPFDAVDTIPAVPNTSIINHPMLVDYRLQLETLDIERRLKAEKLRPKLDLKYQFLRQDIGYSGFATNNYKFGLMLKFPLFLRQARGDLAAAKLKIEQTNWKADQKQAELLFKLEAALRALEVYLDQAQLYESMMINYQRLYEAEVIKFTIGESSLFKLNDRETKLIDARTKFFKNAAKAHIAILKVFWSRGVLHHYIEGTNPPPGN